MGFWRKLAGRLREDRGAYAILFVIITVAVFTMVAIVVDLGAGRSAVRTNRTYADLGMLAGANLLPGNPQGACNEAWTYLIANGAVPAGTASPCSGLPASCPSPPVAVSVSSPVINKTIFTFTYPVPDGDANLFGQSRPAVDGTGPSAACERMALTVRSTLTTLFGGILGSGHLSAPATAVVRAADCQQDNTCKTVAVALLLLDPYACNSLTTQGNNVQVFVRAAQPVVTPSPDPGGPGRITADSNGQSTGNSCNGGQVVIAPNGSSADRIEAFPLGSAPGVIAVYAIQAPNTTCTAGNKACDPAMIVPNTAIIDAAGSSGPGVPTALLNRVTRAPFDHQFNCKGLYPSYNVGGGPALTIAPCSGTPAYIDNLQTAIDGTFGASPATVPVTGAWTPITGAACSPNAATTNIAAGNYWVNCSGGYSVVNNKTVNFACGNVVFQGPVSVTGTLNFNTNCGGRTTYANPACLTAVIGCVNDYSSQAAFIYIRNGDFSVDGTGSAATFSNTAMYIKNGTYGMKSGSPLLAHSAPLEGPFRNLGVWTESSAQMDLKGQSGIGLEGVFFAPQANISYTGQGCNTQTKAQFISRTLSVGGNGCLDMVPNPSRIVPIQLVGIFLIR
jgi:hypothetical protein